MTCEGQIRLETEPSLFSRAFWPLQEGVWPACSVFQTSGPGHLFSLNDLSALASVGKTLLFSSSFSSLNGHLEDISLIWFSVLVYFVVGVFSFVLAEAVLIGNRQLFHFQLSCVHTCPRACPCALPALPSQLAPSWSHLLPKPCATALFVAFCPRLLIFLFHIQWATKSYSSKCSVFIPSF